MMKFEYLVKHKVDSLTLEDTLNVYGEAGWDVAEILPSEYKYCFTVILKRIIWNNP